MTTYSIRDLASAVSRALKSLPVVVLTGMRQTGKTTFLERQEELKGRKYITFDDFAVLDAARRNPEALLAGDGPLTIDEAQKCPELLPVMKREVDKRRRPGRFLLSGSANFALLRAVSESLAGRALYLTLHPFGRREILGTTHLPPFVRAFFDATQPRVRSSATFAFAGGHIALIPSASPNGRVKVELKEDLVPVSPHEVLQGGMPPVCLAQVADPSLWFKSFEQTYLERDLRQLSQVGDLVAFRRLMQRTALRTAQILNQSQLGRDAQLNAMTAGRHLDLLEASFVVHRLPSYVRNRASRLMKAPKIFISDSGLAAHLAGVHDVSPTADEPLRGALLETYAAQNLMSILGAHWPDARLHYWCVQGRNEVDFVIESGRDCLAIEIKAGTRWNSEDLADLRTFLSMNPGCRAAVLAHDGIDAVHLEDRLWALPLAVVLA